MGSPQRKILETAKVLGLLFDSDFCLGLANWTCIRLRQALEFETFWFNEEIKNMFLPMDNEESMTWDLEIGFGLDSTT